MECPKCHFKNSPDSRFCSKCGTSFLSSGRDEEEQTKTYQVPLKELTRETVFAGRYQVIEEVGKGGMGRVYKVFDKKIGERVALKLLNPEIASDKRAVVRFRKELKLARKISHRNVCRMYDLSEEDGTHFITMEYITGEDLKSSIRRLGQLTVGKAVFIARQISEGLAEAHNLDIIHRDLKPQNIMIDKDGNAKIMDFGIARSVEAEGLTDSGMMIGTPYYMSPEQVEGKEADQRSDIYALGIILFEMLTGKVPFEGDTPLSIAVKQKNEVPPDPKKINIQIPEALRFLVFKCMEKDREKRFQKVKEVLAELDTIEKEIQTAEKVISERRTVFSVRKWRKLVIPATIFLAVVFLLSWLLFDESLFPKKKKVGISRGMEWKSSIAVLPFMDISSKRDQEHLCEGMTDAVISILSRLCPELKVISRHSVMRYKETEKDIKEIAKELSVATVLEGSIQREKSQIKVSALLTNSEDNSLIWTDSYNRELESVFEVQDDISRAIAQALKMKLVENGSQDTGIYQPRDIDAYDYFLRGMHIFENKYTLSRKEDDFGTAVGMFNTAIEIDPDYALGYLGLGIAYDFHFYQTRNPKDRSLSAVNLEKAFHLGPGIAETNSAVAWTHFNKGEMEKAYQKFVRALELNPNSAMVAFSVGSFLRSIGLYNQAVPYYNKSIVLDPFHIPSYILCARCLMFTGAFEKAGLCLQNALDIESNNSRILVCYADYLTMIRKNDDAEKILARTEEINIDKSSKALLFATKGDKEKALSFSQGADPNRYYISSIYAVLGMRGEAIEIIKKNIEEGYKYYGEYLYSYPFLVSNPFFKNLHDDIRFEEIIKDEKRKFEEKLKKYEKIL